MAPATEPGTENGGRWPVWKLALYLSPFAWGAVAINLFLLGLMGRALGLAALSPESAMLLAAPLGVPASWWCGKWVRGLMDQADE